MAMTALLISLAVGLTDAPAAHPYLKAKVGDSVTYKMTMANSPPGLKAMTMTKSVAAKTDDSVTLKVVNTMGDMAMPAQEMKINLKEKFDPSKQSDAAKDVKSEMKKLGEGKEKITVGGKTYDCNWSAVEVTTTVNGAKHVAKSKTWMCKDVPLDGMVKMETESHGQKTTMELVAVTTGK